VKSAKAAWFLAAVFAWLAEGAVAEVSISRQELVARLGGKISIGRQVNLQDKEKAVFLSQLQAELRQTADRVLPNNLTTPNEETMGSLLGTNIIIWNQNVEYNRLALEEWLRSLNIQAVGSTKARLPSPEARQALERNIADLRQTAEKAMVEALAEWYTPDEIKTHLDTVEARHRDIILDLTKSSLKVPAGDKEMAELALEFGDRLEESIPRVERRFRNFDKVDDPEAKLRLVNAEKKGCLFQISLEAFSALANLTNDKEREKANPDDIDPGYTQLVQTLRQLEDRLRKEMMEAEKEAQEKARFHDSIKAKMESPRMKESLHSLDDLVEPQTTSPASDEVGGGVQPVEERTQEVPTPQEADRSVFSRLAFVSATILVILAAVGLLRTSQSRRRGSQR